MVISYNFRAESVNRNLYFHYNGTERRHNAGKKSNGFEETETGR